MTAGRPRLPPGPRVPARGHPLRRQADHRRGGAAGRPRATPRTACASGWPAACVDHLLVLLGFELGLAVLSDVLGRVVSLVDALLSEKFTNTTSVRLMEHAATPRPRGLRGQRAAGPAGPRAAPDHGPHALMSQLFGQAQDVITIASFAAGLLVYAPWLIALLVLALVPAFIGEAHFNAQSYSLELRVDAGAARARLRPPDRGQRRDREGSEDLRPERVPHRALPHAVARPSTPRTGAWPPGARAGAACSPPSAPSATTWPTPSSPGARCAATSPSATSPSCPARSAACATCSKGLLIGFSQVAGQALYLDDLFSFFEIEPEIVSPPNPRPFPSPDPRGLHLRGRGLPLSRARSAGRCAT